MGNARTKMSDAEAKAPPTAVATGARSRARVEPSVQEALKHGPGRFSELYVFEPARSGCPARALVKAAQLLKSVELNLAGKPLQVLVALAPGYLKLIGKSHLARQAEAWPGALSSFQVLVQIAAESEDERTYARRLTQRIFGRQLRLKYQSAGGRHLANKGSFGYPEPRLDLSSIPASEAAGAQGTAWLMFQRCVQDVEAFYRLTSEQQDDVMGRPKAPTRREELEQRRLPPCSHVAVSRNGEAPGEGPLLRRSFVYERYAEAGLNFVALAAEPKVLRQALDRFIERDALSNYVALREGGLYFAPSSADWLRPGVKAPVASKTTPEAPFFPTHPLVLYEVTPSAKAFFLELFHANEDQLEDAETGTLRDDVLLLTRGLCKLISGGRLATATALHRLLTELFRPDLSETLFTEENASQTQLAHHWQQLRCELADRKRAYVEAARQRQRAVPALDGQPAVGAPGETERAQLDQARERVRGFLSTNRLVEQMLVRCQLDPGWAEAVVEMLVADAEALAMNVDEAKLRRIEELCARASLEARALNEAFQEYMTITP